MAVDPVIGPGVDSLTGHLATFWKAQGCGLNDCSQDYNVRIDRLPATDGGTDGP